MITASEWYQRQNQLQSSQNSTGRWRKWNHIMCRVSFVLGCCLGSVGCCLGSVGCCIGSLGCCIGSLGSRARSHFTIISISMTENDLRSKLLYESKTFSSPIEKSILDVNNIYIFDSFIWNHVLKIQFNSILTSSWYQRILLFFIIWY